MLRPAVLRCVALTCCDRLAGALVVIGRLAIREVRHQPTRHQETISSPTAKSIRHQTQIKCRGELAVQTKFLRKLRCEHVVCEVISS